MLVDPFLAPNNPKAPVSADEVDPTHILLTHAHVDHLADAVAVAKRTGAHCVALVETAGWLGSKGVENVSDPNLGGTVEFDWGWVKLVQAFHSSTTPDGTVTYASGLVINIGGTTVYHLGDTCLFGDLRLIAERTPVDIALVPIGGHYTMDRHDAVVAAELIGAGTVIPCHYNTFPPIETDAQAFKADVESKTSSKVVVLEPGRYPELLGAARPRRARPRSARDLLDRLVPVQRAAVPGAHRPRLERGQLADAAPGLGDVDVNAAGISPTCGMPVKTFTVRIVSAHTTVRSDSRQSPIIPGVWPGKAITSKSPIRSPSLRRRATGCWSFHMPLKSLSMTLSGFGVGTGALPSSASASAADDHTGAPRSSATACIAPAWSRCAWVMKIAARPRPATWRRIRRRA